MERRRIIMKPRDVVSDPAGSTVQKALIQLGFTVESVRIGQFIDLDINSEPGVADKIAEKVAKTYVRYHIQDYDIQNLDAAPTHL